jgi:hypothetical protein
MSGIEKLETQIKAVEAKLADEVNAVDSEVHALLTECRSWLEAHLLYLRTHSPTDAPAQSPALTDADAAADLAGTPRPSAQASTIDDTSSADSAAPETAAEATEVDPSLASQTSG